MSALKDMVGLTFGRLRVIRRAENRNSRSRWFCVCDCGSETIIDGGSMRLGHTQSCGCLNRDVTLAATIKHGHTMDGTSRTYNSWRGMKDRCSHESHSLWHRYGGRGIIVCDRWLGSSGFSNFLNDMGERPERMTLDRHPNPDGNYEPGNCRWATSSQQNRNRGNK